MTRLPPELAPWAGTLDGLTADAVAVLGAWLPRLRARIGPLRERIDARTGEPDGYAGLTRRGAWERLLVSEWALADALPDEFLRRAAEGEQLFLAPLRRAPHAARRAVVLFDAGPDQLGAPRLVHLALLVVLARRAADAGATLIAGTLQGGPFAPELPRALGLLAGARTDAVPDDARLADWRARLEPGDDGFVVGGAEVVAQARALGLRPIRVDDDGDDVAVTVGDPTPVRLTIPDRQAAVRVLRDPVAAVDVPVGEPADPALAFDTSGGWILLRSADGTAIAVRNPLRGLPKKGFRTKRIERRYGRHWVALGMYGRHLCVVGSDGEVVAPPPRSRVRWDRAGTGWGRLFFDRPHVTPGRPGVPGNLEARAWPRMLVVDEGRLIGADLESGRVESLGSVTAFAQREAGLYTLEPDADHGTRIRHWGSHVSPRDFGAPEGMPLVASSVTVLDTPMDRAVLCAIPFPQTRSARYALAVAYVVDDRWHLWHPDRERPSPVAAGLRTVAGLVWYVDRCSIVEHDDVTVSEVRTNRRKTLLTPPGGVRAVAVATGHPTIAVLDGVGLIHVHDLSTDRAERIAPHHLR